MIRRASEYYGDQHAAQVCKDFFAMAPAEEEAQVEEQPIALSEDAITFQAYTRTFERTGITDGTLQGIQEHGYLLNWTRERWENAQIELAQARLVRARQQYGATSMQDVIEEDIYEDDEQIDWD